MISRMSTIGAYTGFNLLKYSMPAFSRGITSGSGPSDSRLVRGKSSGLGLSADTVLVPDRLEQIAALRSGPLGTSAGTGPGQFDVLVIGGGCTGAGVALDAALRGLKVACVEREDFSSETSAKSTKLIWGGSRYLANALTSLLNSDLRLLKRPRETLKNFYAEIKMVLDCHRERKFMLQEQPHLTNWIPLVVPYKRWLIWPPPFGFSLAAVGPLGLFPFFFKLYDSLSGFSCPHSYILGPNGLGKYIPQIDNLNIKYASVFYEGQHNDTRTNLALALTAAKNGATMCNYCEVVQLIKAEDGKIKGAVVQDKLSGEAIEVSAKTVVFCGGPFTDELRKLDDPKNRSIVMGASGTHIVVDRKHLPDDFGVLDMNTSDGRFLFVLPWQDHVLIGTTDRRVDTTRGPVPCEEDIEWLIKESGKFFKDEFKLTRADVRSAWTGIRPLAADPSHEGKKGEMVSRDHLVHYDKRSGSILVAGGKWTTYRHMAEDAVDEVVKHLNYPLYKECQTLKAHLVGYEGYSNNLPAKLMMEFNISEPLALHLTRSYGGRSRDVLIVAKSMDGGFKPLVGNHGLFPHIAAEVVYSVRHEWAEKIADMVGRRSRLAYLDKEAAEIALPAIGMVMAAELGWSDDRLQRELDDARSYLGQFVGRK